MFRTERDRMIDTPWQMHSCFLQVSASSTFRISRRNHVTLWLKALQRSNSTISGSGPELVDVSWKRLGVPASVAATLRSAFPHVENPTKTQARLIPAILSGKDVLLKGHTGTGKCVESTYRLLPNTILTNRLNYRSFGLILALLSDFRVWRSEHESHKKPGNPSVSALVVVPHKDLALQLARWIQVITESKIQVQPPELSSVVQVLAKVPGEPLEDRLAELERITPHILIGTPQVLLNNYDALKLHKLNTVVVDEVDYLIETVPNLSDHFKREKMRKKIAKYPGPTRQLLNKILEPRMIKPNNPDPDTTPTPTDTTRRPQIHHTPQLILSTATFRSHLNRFLFQGSGWLTRGDMHLVKINGNPKEAETSPWSPNATHSVLVVNEELEIRNIEGAIAAPDSHPAPAEEGEMATQAAGEGEGTLREVITEGVSGVSLGEEDLLASEAPEYETPPPWSPGSIEAISICFAMEVPQTALLVTPATHPIRRLIKELKGYGVDARPLDMLSPITGKDHTPNSESTGTAADCEGPILLVSTLANTRGLDLPDLSHVFVMGVLEGRVDSYTHIAGRTARFGKGGKVVTVVEKIEEEVDDGKGGKKMRVVKDEEKKMKGILREMRIIPRKIEHFD